MAQKHQYTDDLQTLQLVMVGVRAGASLKLNQLCCPIIFQL